MRKVIQILFLLSIDLFLCCSYKYILNVSEKSGKNQIILYPSNKEKVIPFQWYTKCCKLILSKLFSVIQKKTLLKFDLKCIMTVY